MVYAGFWKRLCAYVIDFVIFMCFFMCFCFGIGLFIRFSGMDITEQDIDGAETFINLGSILVFWLYYALMESSLYQGTLGKMAMGIKVVDSDWNPVSFWKATGRHFSKLVSAIIFYVGFFMIGFTEKKQGLHDKMAGTLVVNDK